MDLEADDTVLDEPAADEAEEHRVDDESGENADADGGDDSGEQGEEPAGDGEEVVVGFGDEPEAEAAAEARAPEWVRELRKSNREKDRRIRELEQQVKTGTPAQAAVVVGDKPTLAGCDYDTERYESELQQWHTRKLKADEQQRQQQEAQQRQEQQFQARSEAVQKAGAALKFRDYDDAVDALADQFSVLQLGILRGAPDDPKNSALLQYALGKNPKKAKELAAITDPVKFTFALAKLESQMKVTTRKSAPAPEGSLRSTVARATAVDNRLAQLREEAAKTGDMTKVLAYKKAQKAKSRG